ncbi:MAG: RagB/SusD family nutrient uptake outer membrane protein [Pedobacter sp.]|uniref:RagB/SusD family nutrient uptake outer membrane protein n=1 Tax=Pedobacter sp. TaxID=1411316 RepID=UPI0028076DC8|nr:RagB/SusD family nutrient uptake outer membrane protein [Pedobacter sp.]MDQ8006618.1 RagB/SusD family nutrient uptake outer membrane protein [Pedobacter sp.]
MNKKFLYTVFTLLLIGLGSCKKSYLDTNPSDQIKSDRVFDNINNVRVNLNGIYRMLYMQYSNQEEDGQASMMIVFDFLGEDIVHTATGTSYFRGSYRWADHRAEGNALPLFSYRMYYRILANVNMLLSGLDRVPDVSQVELNTVKGELLSLRAFSHFMLVQLFGKRYNLNDVGLPDNKEGEFPNLGAPLMTFYSEQPQPRASVDDMYASINKDLDEAILLLAGAPARGIYRTHIDKSVAHGLKARVALTQWNWDLAITNAKEARKGYTLMSNAAYLDGFTDMKNAEWMWGAHQLTEQLPTYGSFYAYMSSNFNSAHTRPNPKLINVLLYNSLTVTDVRRKLFCDDVNDFVNFPGVVNASTGQPEPQQVRRRLMHKKFVVADPAVSGGDIPFMRAAEMYLIEAEALAMKGLKQEALDVIKVLAMNRDPNLDPATIDVDDIATYIDIQRRIELWGEGFRFLDLKRKNQALDRTGTGATTELGQYLERSAGGIWWQFKIPRREIQANPFINVNNP